MDDVISECAHSIRVKDRVSLALPRAYCCRQLAGLTKISVSSMLSIIKTITIRHGSDYLKIPFHILPIPKP